MPLNAEEKFKSKQYATPTLEQLEIAKLEEELQSARDSLHYLDDYVDKLTDQRDRVNGHIAHYESHERSAGITLDAIMAVLR